MAITSLSEATAQAVGAPKILVYGRAGKGKTSLLGTTSRKMLLLSAESGLAALHGCPNPIDVMAVTTPGELLEGLKAARSGAYEVVALDSISEIAEIVLSEELKNAKDPRQAYGELITKMTTIMKAFRDLKGVAVVLVAKEQAEKDEKTGRIFASPMMPGSKLSSQTTYLFDVVMRAVSMPNAETKQDDFHLVTRGDSYSFDAKDRTGTLDAFEAPDLDAIFEKISGQKKASDVDWSSIDDEKEGAK